MRRRHIQEGRAPSKAQFLGAAAVKISIAAFVVGIGWGLIQIVPIGVGWLTSSAPRVASVQSVPAAQAPAQAPDIDVADLEPVVRSTASGASECAQFVRGLAPYGYTIELGGNVLTTDALRKYSVGGRTVFPIDRLCEIMVYPTDIVGTLPGADLASASASVGKGIVHTQQYARSIETLQRSMEEIQGEIEAMVEKANTERYGSEGEAP